MNKFFLIFHTVRHLRPIQIRYQFWLRVRHVWRKVWENKYALFKNSTDYPVVLKEYISKYSSFNNYSFTFLNQSVDFNEKEIEWNYNSLGKLWTYNLNYFDFLLQFNMDTETGIKLISDFISKLDLNPTALEPYPIALRGINWIKFLSKSTIPNKPEITSSLYAQYQILADNLEYHLLGNHLLEDGFSLLFGAFFFKDEKLYKKAVKIIEPQLNEQILEDGAHFELSPMYHQIILDRLLDCINLIQNNQRFINQEDLLLLMHVKAVKMIYWLNCMTFSNGQIPLFNDSAPGIAPTTNQLNHYAVHLGILEVDPIHINRNNSCISYLKESGYRRFNGINYECILDIGPIGPTYQPGHAHADTFNFVLNVHNHPCIIDPGISTYEANKVRLKERGTLYHNTVNIHDQNSSCIWSSFRVANRANVTIVKENNKSIISKHNGYSRKKTIHQRKWEFEEQHIKITDSLIGNVTQGKAHFWFASNLNPEILDQSVKVKDINLMFKKAEKIELLKGKIPAGYNKYEDNYRLEVTFKSQLLTILTIN